MYSVPCNCFRFFPVTESVMENNANVAGHITLLAIGAINVNYETASQFCVKVPEKGYDCLS